jgi:hypothetical protein
MSVIFTLQKPVHTKIYLIQEDIHTEGTLSLLNVFTRKEGITIEGKVLVPEKLAKQMCDLVSRRPKGIFNIRFYSEDEVINIKQITGNRYSSFWLENDHMAYVYFNQKGVQGTSFVRVEPNPENAKGKPKDFIMCPTEPPKYPSLGDLYFDPQSKAIRMYMSSGWNDTQIKVENQPAIAAEKKIAIPDNYAAFFCQPLEKRKWEREIESRRIAKVLKATRRKHQ